MLTLTISVLQGRDLAGAARLSDGLRTIASGDAATSQSGADSGNNAADEGGVIKQSETGTA